MSLMRDIIWGSRPVTSRLEFKYAMLRGEFAIIIMMVVVFYICLDMVNEVYVFLSWYFIMILTSATAMIFNRRQRYTLSNVIILSTLNFLIYIFADVDHPNGGVYFYLITTSMAGLVLISYYNLKTGLFFAFLPIALGFIAFFWNLNLIPPPVYEENMVSVNFLSNFSIALLASVFMLQFLLNRNKESEDSLVCQNQLLEKANKELDHFVYSVSHDLRAPLSSILGLTNVYHLAIDDKEKTAFVKMIHERAHALDKFIREVLDYSRNARVELNLQPVNVYSVVKEVLHGMLYLNGVEDVTIENRVDPTLTVATDQERIKVVLNNLLGNAIHYRDPGKMTSSIVIESSVSEGNWVIAIKDNGIGIKQEHLARIFEMFYKAHDRAHGTGLGLYIVKETLQRLNGDIKVESEYGIGTTFVVTLAAGVDQPQNPQQENFTGQVLKTGDESSA